MSGSASMDRLLQNALPTDIVIPIIGATGAGKSTFINYLLRGYAPRATRRVMVGDELVSCTSKLEYVIFENQTDSYIFLKGHRIVIVDTPGFGDTTGLDNSYAGDFEILKRIARWLEESYQQRKVLGGLIWLHDISQDRVSETARRNLEMFSLLCADASLDKVVFVTSKWGRAHGCDLDKREGELRRKHWKDMLAGGARVMSLKYGSEEQSACQIVEAILQNIQMHTCKDLLTNALKMQQVMVNRHRFNPQTEEAKELRHQLQQMLDVQTQMLTLEAAAAAGEPGAEEQLWQTQEKVKQMAAQVRYSTMSLGQRLQMLVRVFLE